GRAGIHPDDAKTRLGQIASLGTLAYAVGKFISGATAEYLGGRRTFLAGMAGAILFTIAFSLGGAVPFFAVAWFGNRLLQSLGWGGMVKIASRWSPPSRYATVMAAISLSYLFGDAVARFTMGEWLALGMSWREVFWACAACLAGLLVVSWLLLR